MSYETIAIAAKDYALGMRIAACVAQESDGTEPPEQVAASIQWKCAAEPGWGEAWESALAAQPDPDPEVPLQQQQFSAIGNDPAVITDGMILSAVQKHLPEGGTP